MGSELVLILVIPAVACVRLHERPPRHGERDGDLDPDRSVEAARSGGDVAVLNFVCAFISISVAATIANDIVNPAVLAGNDGRELVLAALIGALT